MRLGQWWPLALCALAGCAPINPSVFARRSVPTNPAVELLYPYPGSAGDAVEASLRRVLPRLEPWGGLRQPVRIQVLSDHAALERAVEKPGYAWLRAWARYDEVFLQDPASWGLFTPGPRDLDELLLHELTHCALFQGAGDRDSWQHKRIPLWFREGMASVTAEQAHRWPTLEELARVYDAEPGTDPLRQAEELARSRSELVYGAAHHAFAFLLRRYGHERVRLLMSTMRRGSSFPDAFEEALGISSSAFESDFERYLRLRGFRAERLRPSPQREALVTAEAGLSSKGGRSLPSNAR